MLAPDEMKIATLALAILLGTGAAAQAGSVDWSEYIDKNPSKPVAVARPTTAPADSREPVASKPARAGKKVAAKPKAAKPKARAKAKRRH